MRQFMWGVAAAVIGGFLLFWLTNWYTDWSARGERKLSYEFNVAATFIGEEEFEAILNIAEQKGSGKIALLTIKNVGESNLRDAKFVIRGDTSDFDKQNLHGFGVASTIGDDVMQASMKLTENGIETNFPFLKSGDGAVLWIAHEPPQGFNLIPLDEKIEFEEVSSWEKGDSGLDFFFVFLIGLVCLFVGGWIADSINKNMLKKAGLEPDQVSARYLRAMAEEAEAKIVDKDAQDKGSKTGDE